VISEADDIERNRLINRRQLRKLVPASDMSIWRWTRAGIFPQPIKINGRNYWRLQAVIAVAQRTEASRGGNAPPAPLPGSVTS
jgi:predicted DNA-binding transcriptional regulator AlpA